MKNRLKILGMLLLCHSLCSCDKAKKLDEERARLDTQREGINQQLRQIDEHFRLAQNQGNSFVPDLISRTTEANKKATENEAEFANKLQKWTVSEASLKEIQAKVDAWKAKYLK